MNGPFDRLFGHSAFDIDNDGEIDGGEFALMHDLIFSEDQDEEDELDDLRDDIELMDPDEQLEAIEEAGFDPDDFDLDDDFDADEFDD